MTAEGYTGFGNAKEAMKHIRHYRKLLKKMKRHDHVDVCDGIMTHLRGGGKLEGSGIWDVIKHYASKLGEYIAPRRGAPKEDWEALGAHARRGKQERAAEIADDAATLQYLRDENARKQKARREREAASAAAHDKRMAEIRNTPYNL
jgi:hypothetical protein